ncbi:hypothetical protein BGZ52_000264, partial [Haplosporangium bisporale]
MTFVIHGPAFPCHPTHPRPGSGTPTHFPVQSTTTEARTKQTDTMLPHTATTLRHLRRIASHTPQTIVAPE